MNANAELLNFIYQNSQMGVETTAQIIEMIDHNEFKKQLESQLKEYGEIHSEAKDMLNQNGFDEKGINAFEKITSYVMINLKTIHDKSASHISEMMMKGSVMGIIDAIKNIKKYEKDSEKNILTLMKRLQKFEEGNLEQLKNFL